MRGLLSLLFGPLFGLYVCVLLFKVLTYWFVWFMVTRFVVIGLLFVGFGLEFVIDAACWVCCLVWFWWVWAVDNGCFGFVTVLRWFVCCECGFVVIY